MNLLRLILPLPAVLCATLCGDELSHWTESKLTKLQVQSIKNDKAGAAFLESRSLSDFPARLQIPGVSAQISLCSRYLCP